MKGLVKRNTHMIYESSMIFNSLKVIMAKVKILFHATNAEADPRAMTLAIRAFVQAR